MTQPLTKEEKELIESFKKLTPEQQKKVIDTMCGGIEKIRKGIDRVSEKIESIFGKFK